MIWWLETMAAVTFAVLFCVVVVVGLNWINQRDSRREQALLVRVLEADVAELTAFAAGLIRLVDFACLCGHPCELYTARDRGLAVRNRLAKDV